MKRKQVDMSGRPLPIGRCRGCDVEIYGRTTWVSRAQVKSMNGASAACSTLCDACHSWLRNRSGRTIHDRRVFKGLDDVNAWSRRSERPPLGSVAFKEYAACAGKWSPDISWDALTTQENAHGISSRVAAIKVCRKCPVSKQCSEYGAVNKETGIYGGEYLRHGKLIEGSGRHGMKVA